MEGDKSIEDKLTIKQEELDEVYHRLHVMIEERREEILKEAGKAIEVTPVSSCWVDKKYWFFYIFLGRILLPWIVTMIMFMPEGIFYRPSEMVKIAGLFFAGTVGLTYAMLIVFHLIIPLFLIQYYTAGFSKYSKLIRIGCVVELSVMLLLVVWNISRENSAIRLLFFNTLK